MDYPAQNNGVIHDKDTIFMRQIQSINQSLQDNERDKEQMNIGIEKQRQGCDINKQSELEGR